MGTKKIVLFGSLAVFIFVFVMVNPLMFGFCQSVSEWGDGTKYCNYSYSTIDNLAEKVAFFGFFLSTPLFLLSLITYKMRDEVFRAWWRFARWWVPVIIVVTLLLQNAGSGGGLGIGGAISSAFDALILIILYSIFIITSLVKIVRAYLKGNHQNKIRRDLNSPN